ncbi:MAG: sodium:solute symporter family protein [Candidatus Zixiibacteriota bacterium]
MGFRLWRDRGRIADATDFLVGGRRLTLPAFVATLVATWYGGILGVGEYSYLYGISNWLVFGVPYYLWAIVFALFLARPARRTFFLSLPDHLAQAYGRIPAMTGAAVVFVMTVPAAYVLMIGTMGTLLFGWPLWWGIAIGAGMSAVYVLAGGFNSVVRTDKVQFLAMYLGFALIVVFSIATYGGWSFLKTNLPATHFTWQGGNTVWFIVSWFFIAAATLIEPSFYQRCYAAKSESVAKRGILISVLFWMLFDFMSTTAGLYARAAIPELANPESSYPALAARVLPPGLVGIFLVGILAGIFATIDSYMFLAAISIGRDIYGRIKSSTDRGIKSMTRWGLVVSAIVSVLLAIGSQSVIGLWRDLGSIGVPVLLFPVLWTFRRQQERPPTSRVVTWMLLPGVVALGWIGLRVLGPGYPWGVEPIFPGLVTSGVLWVSLIRRSGRG